MSDDYTITVQIYGLDLEDDDLDGLSDIYEEGNIVQHFSETVVVVARNEHGAVIGGVTESGGDELAIGVDEEWQDQGIGTAMVKAFLKAGGVGYMVAGTEAGSSFLMSLPNKLGGFPEELDVPCWKELPDYPDEESG